MRSLPFVFAVCLTSSSAQALITSPVGGRPGEFDLSTRVSLERGKVEPNENEQSFQRARWNMYALGIGYGFGDLGPVRDIYARIDGTYVDSPAEINERGVVTPDRCRGTVVSATGCRFHDAIEEGSSLPRSPGTSCTS